MSDLVGSATSSGPTVTGGLTGYQKLQRDESYLDPTIEKLPAQQNTQRHAEDNDYGKVFISGAGFLADAYDLFVINVAVDLMAQVSYQQPLSHAMRSAIKSSALVGAVVGQIMFGALADMIGRRKVFLATCFLVIVGALLSASAPDSSSIYTQLCIYRFLLGVGIGGEYPLSASVTSERACASSGQQARDLAMVFSMQGFGTLLCSLVLVILTSTLGSSYGLQWRLALGAGALPMMAVAYARYHMHEAAWKAEAEVGLIPSRRQTSLCGSLTECARVVSQCPDAWRRLHQNWTQLLSNVHKQRVLLLGTAGKHTHHQLRDEARRSEEHQTGWVFSR